MSDGRDRKTSGTGAAAGRLPSHNRTVPVEQIIRTEFKSSDGRTHQLLGEAAKRNQVLIIVDYLDDVEDIYMGRDSDTTLDEIVEALLKNYTIDPIGGWQTPEKSDE